MKKTILLGITGSIAAYKACELVRSLRKADYDIICIMTKEAKEFVSKLTFETLSGNSVVDDMFCSPGEWDIKHVSLAEKASLVIIAPATANIISKIASGICDDSLTTIISATKAPVIIAPAMNDNMYNNKIIQENIAKLKRHNFIFIGPVKGKLASGYEAIGHIEDTEKIAVLAKKVLSSK